MQKANKWLPGWDGLAFADAGGRLNGTHRLNAIIESGVSCWMLVIRGLPEDSVIVGDQGTKRTTQQVLAQMGKPNPHALAPALRYLWQWRNDHHIGDKSQDATPDVTDLLTLLQKEPTVTESVSLGTRLRSHAGLGSDGLGVVLVHLFMETDPDEAEVFLDHLMRGTELQSGDPILVLREHLAALRAGSGATKGIDVTHKAAVTIKAFNYWRVGVKIDRIGWRRGGSRPEPFPGIEPAQADVREVIPQPDPAHRPQRR